MSIERTSYFGPEARSVSMSVEVRGVKGKPNAALVAGRASNHGNWYPVHDSYGTYQERTHYPVLKNCDTSECVLLFGHQGMPYGSVSGGNLKLNETTRGIEWECELDTRSQAHRDLLVTLERGDAKQGSVGMVVGKDEWNDDFSRRDIRGLSRLVDVTITPHGANPDTASFVANRDAGNARVLAIADAEYRQGKTHSAATVKALKEMLKDHKQGTKVLHKAIASHVQDLLDQGGDYDGTQGGSSGGQNTAGTTPPNGSMVDGTFGRARWEKLTRRQKDILIIYAEIIEEEERESEARRKMVAEIVKEARMGVLS